LVKDAEYYKQRADQGNPSEQNNYAHCLRQGIGVAKDLDKTIYYEQLAGGQVGADAQERDDTSLLQDFGQDL